MSHPQRSHPQPPQRPQQPHVRSRFSVTTSPTPDAERGLLWSSLCLWVRFRFASATANVDYSGQSYKCISMGNGFWNPTDKRKRSAVGKINGLTQVTTSTIAYVIAQVRLSLPHPQISQKLLGTIWAVVMRGMGRRRRSIHIARLLPCDNGALRG